MIRVFVTTWSGIAGGEVTNPIETWLDSNELGVPLVCSQYYADADKDGLPDKPLVVVVVRQPDGAVNASGENIEMFDKLPGVRMLPAVRLSARLDDISEQLINRIEQDVPTIRKKAAYGEALKDLVKGIQPNFTGFGRHYEDADGEFG